MRKAEDRDARLKKIVPTEKAEKVREHVLMNIDRTEKSSVRGYLMKNGGLYRNAGTDFRQFV